MIYKFIDYINDKFTKDEENIDYNFSKINDNIFIKSYVGFKDIENIQIFNNIDFSVYKILFPNSAAFFFSFLCNIVFLPLFGLLVFLIIRKIKDLRYNNYYNDMETENLILVIINCFYWIFFLDFLFIH